MIAADEAHKHMSKGAVVTHGAVMLSDSNGRIFTLLYCKCHVTGSPNNNNSNNNFYFFFAEKVCRTKMFTCLCLVVLNCFKCATNV